MATRESVVNFLKQASITEMDPLEFAYGDMYFSTFLNQVPYQLENYLKELVDPAQDVVAFSKGSEGKTRNKVYMVECSSSPRHFVRVYVFWDCQPEQ